MLRHHARLLLLAVATISSGVSAHAQSPAYAGGAVTVVSQTHPTTLQLGGTTWAGSLLFGVPVSPRLSLEFEPSFVGSFHGEYTYSPLPFRPARVVTRRRDVFFTFQLRARTGFLEPVVGVSYVRGTASRRATFVDSGRPYFDDGQSENAFALAGGIDASIKLTSHVFFVPTFRALIVARPSYSVGRAFEPDFRDIIGLQTSGGRFVFRYGAGARVAF